MRGDQPHPGVFPFSALVLEMRVLEKKNQRI